MTSLKAALVVSFAFSCHAVYAEADFSCLELARTKPIKLVNPLYLDGSRIEKPTIKLNTPYTGTQFDESDYFSSEIQELPPPAVSPSDIPTAETSPSNLPPFQQADQSDVEPPKSNFPPFQQADQSDVEPPKSNLPPFSTGGVTERETAPSHLPPNLPPRQNAPPDNAESQEFNVIPINDFFAPPQSLQDTDEIYSAAVNSEETPDLEGKIISGVRIEGLKLLKPDVVQSKIKIGSFFNEELIQQDLQRIYATGFFTDRMSVEPILKSDDTVELVFTVQENIPVTEVSVIGNTVISSMELMPFVIPLKNKPQNISNINDAIQKLNGYYHSKGYILAGVSSVDDYEDGSLSFCINEGVIDKIVIEGNEKTKDYVIERNIMTQPGTVYNENYLKEDLARIYSTKIFKEVNREILPSETGAYNVKVVVKEDSPNSLALGGGIDNALGAFGSVSYSENNFLGRGQRLTLSGILGSGILLSDASIKNRMNYQLELSFFEPYFLNADNSLMSKLYYRDMGSWQVPLAIERRFGINAGIEHKVRGYDNLTTNFTAGIEHISMSEGDFNKISQLYALRNLDIAQRAKQLTGGTFINLAPGIRYSTLDTNENPRNGIIAEAKFMEAFGISNINHTNGRLAGGVTKYFPVRKKSSFSLTARGGIKVHGNEMPEVMAFRLGGPYSVRGFRMSGVGAGDAFIMGSAELATPLPFVDRLKWDFLQKIRLTFFVDAGKVFDPTISSVLYDRPMGAISAGIGLRVFIPGVGPISVDYGIPLTNPGDYGSKNGYFTFGTGVNPYGY